MCIRDSFRAITREALKKINLTSDGMEFASEMLMEAVENGLRIKEVPISYYKRKSGRSKLSSFQDGWRHLKFMLIYTPNHLFIYPGIVLITLGVLWMLTAQLKIFIGYLPGIHSMIAGSMLTIVGYQALFFGLFAKIHLGKQVPRFLTLERGAIAGISILLFGLACALYSVSRWILSGFTELPSIELDIMAFTAMVLGMQTFFSSFMLSGIMEYRRKKSSRNAITSI